MHPGHFADHHDDLRSEGHASLRCANPNATDHDDHRANPNDHPNEVHGNPRYANPNATDHDDHHANPNESCPRWLRGSLRAYPMRDDPQLSACQHPGASPWTCRQEGDRSPQAFRIARAMTAFPRFRAKAHQGDRHWTAGHLMACALILRVNYLLLASPFPSMCPRVGALSPQTTKATRRWPLLKNCPAASYSPTQSPVQYHRR